MSEQENEGGFFSPSQIGSVAWRELTGRTDLDEAGLKAEAKIINERVINAPAGEYTEAEGNEALAALEFLENLDKIAETEGQEKPDAEAKPDAPAVDASAGTSDQSGAPSGDAAGDAPATSEALNGDDAGDDTQAGAGPDAVQGSDEAVSSGAAAASDELEQPVVDASVAAAPVVTVVDGPATNVVIPDTEHVEAADVPVGQTTEEIEAEAQQQRDAQALVDAENAEKRKKAQEESDAEFKRQQQEAHDRRIAEETDGMSEGVKGLYTNAGATGQAALRSLYKYLKDMGPNRPVSEQEISQAQTQLYRTILSVINRTGDDFQVAFTAVLRVFRENTEGAFADAYLMRGMDNIALPLDDQRAFQRLVSLLRHTADPADREITLKQFNVTQALSFGVTEEGRGKVMGYFNL